MGHTTEEVEFSVLSWMSFWNLEWKMPPMYAPLFLNSLFVLISDSQKIAGALGQGGGYLIWYTDFMLCQGISTVNIEQCLFALTTKQEFENIDYHLLCRFFSLAVLQAGWEPCYIVIDLGIVYLLLLKWNACLMLLISLPCKFKWFFVLSFIFTRYVLKLNNVRVSWSTGIILLDLLNFM